MVTWRCKDGGGTNRENAKEDMWKNTMGEIKHDRGWKIYSKEAENNVLYTSSLDFIARQYALRPINPSCQNEGKGTVLRWCKREDNS